MASLRQGPTNVVEFLTYYPDMAVRPNGQPGLNLEGIFRFAADPPPAFDTGRITDAFKLRIYIPPGYPKAIPVVWETGGKIYPPQHFHINPDQTICLGTPLELLLGISRTPTLLGFTDNYLIPYLYAASYKLKYGGPFLFGEYAHGSTGLIESYTQLLELNDHSQVRNALMYLSMKERDANKLPCACECGKRQGACKFNAKLKLLRQIASRKFIRENYQP